MVIVSLAAGVNSVERVARFYSVWIVAFGSVCGFMLCVGFRGGGGYDCIVLVVDWFDVICIVGDFVGVC